MAIHAEPSPFAGKIVNANIHGEIHQCQVEDWWDRINGQSWMDCRSNPACLVYAIDVAKAGLPLDNNVLYVKIGGYGQLIHASQIIDSSGEAK